MLKYFIYYEDTKETTLKGKENRVTLYSCSIQLYKYLK